MFVHGKTGKTYYSVREKIKYYNKIAYNDKTISNKQKDYALKRLEELKKIDKQSYEIPKFIMTDDSKFGNQISKPRLCLAIKEDSKKRILVAPVYKTDTNFIVFDNNVDRQISKTEKGKNKWVDRSDIYETKYISPLFDLTERDIKKIKRVYK